MPKRTATGCGDVLVHPDAADRAAETSELASRLTEAAPKPPRFHARNVLPGLRGLDPQLPDQLAAKRPLTPAWRRLEQTIDRLVAAAQLMPQS
jgi:hypothetical protein